ncbi:hypothetical protein [Actinophytocola oryzae]|uniref:Uncharacterized protein n=1 Tax=Actinophytocola oryzae TaxID=502181 RepID=A0A4R7UYB5_9PSEU|nr:hypothetical protein [Actinophytocola oryzae]TDV40066.1 hypothetical protein CLV71_12483 [Actinophytocola oryzae]
MRVATLFDGRDADGEWTFAPGRPIVTDPAERARIADFLGGGRMIVRIWGSDLDRITPANGRVVPMSTLTDGTWIWGAALEYYVRTHGIAPEPEFLAHIVAHEYVAPQPEESAWRAALDQIS